MNVNHKIARRIALMMLLGAALAGCASAPSEPSPDLLHKIEHASTRGDHETLAVYYEREGAAARAVAVRHRKMAAGYQARNDRSAAGMSAHCNAIALRQESIAAEYEGMAEGHQAVANEIKP